MFLPEPAWMAARRFSLFYGHVQVLRNVTLEIPAQRVTALIGPSGCGKSSLLRALNRMNDLIPGARGRGSVTLNGEEIYAPGIDVNELRRRVGMVFQQPNPFPLSIFENVGYGPRRHGVKDRRLLAEIVEHCLRRAGLWTEVRGRLQAPALSLSGGQQQRLCLARALAVEPEVLLMDEPSSALDPAATQRLEELIGELRRSYAIVLVTHDLHQAARVGDLVAFLLHGQLIEHGSVEQVLYRPQDARTRDFVEGGRL